MNSQRIKPVFLFLIFGLLSVPASAQIQTVSGFNYFDVNEQSLNVSAACKGLNTEKTKELEYFYTTFQLAKDVNDIFENTRTSIDTVVGHFKISKRAYLNKSLGGEQFRWILIRPDDTIRRPTIAITHGGKTGGASPQRVYTMGVFDYVQRGYAVIYYQSGSTQNSDQALMEAGLAAKCYQNVQCPTSSWSPDCDVECFQQAVLLKTQFGIAALQYAAHHTNTFHLDTSLFFAIGFSGGGVGTFYTAFSDSTTFSDTLFSTVGGLDALSQHPSASYSIRGIATLAGGIIDSTTVGNKIKKLIDTSDKNVRVLLLHGQNDFAVYTKTAPLLWSDPKSQLVGSQIKTAFDLKDELDDNQIKNRLVINCSGCHSMFSWPCKYNDDCFGNNPAFAFCKSWTANSIYASFDYTNLCASTNDIAESNQIYYVMSQVHDYAKLVAWSFHQDFGLVGPPAAPGTFASTILTSNRIGAVNPVSFPFDENNNETNGHLIVSEKCLTQQCKGLYFDRNGLGLTPVNLLYSGDFATVPTFGSSVFNNDFSIEISFKTIDHKDIGVLFSSINNSTKGFEIFINKQGKLQWNKNDSKGLGNITGSTVMAGDSCHHVALTRSGNEFSLYLNGVLQGRKSFQANFPAVAKYRLGNTLVKLGDKKGFNGMMKNLRFWDKTLTVSELNQNSLSSSTSNLLSEWQFDLAVEQEVPNTKNTSNVILGDSKATARYDPRWMENDEMCECADRQTTSIDHRELNQSASFVVYPNPSSGSFIIEDRSYNRVNSDINIYDLEGRLISSYDMLQSKLVISKLEIGVYIIEIVNADYRHYMRVISN